MMENKYIMGVDTYDLENSAVCVYNIESDVIEVMETIRGEKEFNRRVEELKKSYNTVSIQEYTEKTAPKREKICSYSSYNRTSENTQRKRINPTVFV